jgi:hypothetical protein
MPDPTTVWDPNACAAAGVALLDADPDWAGWREWVDPDRLDMADGIYRGEPACFACVGAQLHYHQQVARLGDRVDRVEGDYGEFLYAIALDEEGFHYERRAWAVTHGFTIPDDLDPGTVAEEQAAWDRLTAAWQTLLAATP